MPAHVGGSLEDRNARQAIVGEHDDRHGRRFLTQLRAHPLERAQVRLEIAAQVYGAWTPVIESDIARGSRRRHPPLSTAVRKAPTARLKASGSSRFAVWPVRGRITRPDMGMVRLSMSEGSRLPSSSSPASTSTGVTTARS